MGSLDDRDFIFNEQNDPDLPQYADLPQYPLPSYPPSYNSRYSSDSFYIPVTEEPASVEAHTARPRAFTGFECHERQAGNRAAKLAKVFVARVQALARLLLWPFHCARSVSKEVWLLILVLLVWFGVLASIACGLWALVTPRAPSVTVGPVPEVVPEVVAVEVVEVVAVVAEVVAEVPVEQPSENPITTILNFA